MKFLGIIVIIGAIVSWEKGAAIKKEKGSIAEIETDSEPEVMYVILLELIKQLLLLYAILEILEHQNRVMNGIRFLALMFGE